jgi:hypothetical protein
MDNICLGGNEYVIGIGSSDKFTTNTTAEFHSDYNFLWRDVSVTTYSTNMFKWINVNGTVSTFLGLPQYQNGTNQDLHSISQADVVWNELTFTPYANSPVCGAASDGGDIGAVACSSTSNKTIVISTGTNSTLTEQAHTTAMANAVTYTTMTGIKIVANANTTIDSITLNANSTATIVYIADVSKTIQAISPVVGGVATFDYDIVAGETYYIGANSNTTTYNMTQTISPPDSITNTRFTVTKGWYGSTSYDMSGMTEDGFLRNFETITTSNDSISELYYYTGSIISNGDSIKIGATKTVMAYTPITPENNTIRLYNGSGSQIYISGNPTNTNNLTFQLNASGTYYYNATTENSTHIIYTTTRSFTVYEVETYFTAPSYNAQVGNNLFINWSLNTTSSVTMNYTHLLVDNIFYKNITGANVSNYTWNAIYYANLTPGLHQLRLNTTLSDNQIVSVNTSINITSNTMVNITAYYHLNNTAISSFNGWLYNYETSTNTSYTTTSGIASINTTRGNITVYIDNEDFAYTNNTQSRNVTTADYNFTFRLYETNSVNITFYNEATPTTILAGPTITLELIGTGSYNYTTTTGQIYASLITPSEYIARYYSTGYLTRFYTFTLSNRTSQILSLYMLNDTNNINLTVSVVDDLANKVTGVTVKSLKYDLATNSYLLQEVRDVNSNGQTTFSVTYNDEYYKFIVEDSSGTVLKITDPTYITTTTMTIQITTSTNNADEMNEYESLSHSLTFNTGTNNFRLDYSDSNNIIEGILLTVYKNDNQTRTLYNSSTSSSAAGSLLINVEAGNGTTYEAFAYYLKDDEYKYLGGKTYSFLDTTRLVWGAMGLFAQILLTLGLSALAFISPIVGVIMAPLSLVLGAYLGWIQFNAGIIAGTMLVVGVILAVIISMRK